ncbi:hypothetical protein L208DRAFT_1413372 [Tricholoma matsutake]|nr:hypothetical protein L208DRAFT_1413372 [Tricholoma matsutake 945]
MPITEFAIFQLLHPHTFHSGSAADLFRKLNAWQAEISTYPLYFFADKVVPSTIYLISGWHNVDAHMQWVASDRNQELLRVAKPLLTVKGMVHLDIDFTAMPMDCDVVTIKKRGEHYLKEQSGSVEYEVNSLALSPTWIGIGQDLEPGSATVYEISAGWGFGTVEEEGSEPTVMTMKRLYIS